MWAKQIDFGETVVFLMFLEKASKFIKKEFYKRYIQGASNLQELSSRFDQMSNELKMLMDIQNIMLERTRSNKI